MDAKSLKRLENIQQKLDRLRVAQRKIEGALGAEMVDILKYKRAFQLDADALIGGLLNVVEAVQSEDDICQKWQVEGAKFRREARSEWAAVEDAS